MQKRYFVYILSNFTNTTLYIGVTNDIVRRVYEHKHKVVKGFTEKYNISKLVYFEELDDPESAILREKQLKNWHRGWKLNFIRQSNPDLVDLYEQILK